ncbi:hypothetical protein EDD22DRAFT_953476 [Suillus occidentalis]|nr:hypothetical protein EDD22DRAFT_953476 [Suillus occidentalis]
MNIQSASSSATLIEDVPVISATPTLATTSTAIIYRENISNANEEAIIESAILSRQHTLEIKRILVERNAYPTAAVLNTIRTAKLIEQEAMLITDPTVKQSILHYQGRIRRLCYLLLPSNIKEDILHAIFIILERTTTQVARPPSPHLLDEYIRIPSTPPSETPKPVLPPMTQRTTVENQATISPHDLELGTQASPIVVPDSDSTPSSPNARVTCREQKQRLRISSKSVSPTKPPVKVSPTTSLPTRLPINDNNNFVCCNCKKFRHRHKNCPKYWDLPVKRRENKIPEPPSSDHKQPDFYQKLTIWEAHIDEEESLTWQKEHAEELAEFEEHYAQDYSDDPIHYANQDD